MLEIWGIMESYIVEFLGLLVRWIHVTTGVAWIGASFYFNWLEGNLDRTKPQEEGVAGNLWAVHGGGFYYLKKFEVAPEKIPEKLHWFKWEAYFTWISGMSLLSIVYYFNAKTYMIDPNIMDMSSAKAIGISLSSFLIGWFVYDFLCKSPLIKKPVLFSALGIGLLTGAAYFYSSIYTGRAAYIHVGALIGTIMALNVFMKIIPAQKELVNAGLEGRKLDPTLGKMAAKCSLHNNYFTLPLLFIMISNHYPSTYGHEFNWIVLFALSVISAGVRHWFNLRNQSRKNVWILPAAAVAMIGMALVTAPKSTEHAKNVGVVEFSQVQGIINMRCLACHSSNNTDDTFKVAVNGVIFETEEQIMKFSDRIYARAVQLKSMPFANKTKITEEERSILGAWYEQLKK